MVDHLSESPFRKCLHQMLSDASSLPLGLARLQARKVHSGKLLGTLEVIMGHRGAVVLGPDKLGQIRTGASQQVGIHSFRSQRLVIVALASLQRAWFWCQLSFVCVTGALVHQFGWVLRLKGARERHACVRSTLLTAQGDVVVIGLGETTAAIASSKRNAEVGRDGG